MLIVGENLEKLMNQYNMTDRKGSFDETCIQLSLGESYITLKKDKDRILTYGEEIPKEIIKSKDIDEEGLIINPQKAVLACSAEIVKIPAGYFGLLQTKGSLARMFVSLHFSDGQIDPGFEGKVTFEVYNAGEYPVRIHKYKPVGNLYIFKASTDQHKMYDGKYCHAEGPTIPEPVDYIRE